jgi:hypothetical protein
MENGKVIKKRRKLSKYFREGPYKYQKYLNRAKQRNIIMELSESDMISLFNQNCHYCGKPPKPKLNGVDRIDNNNGYTKTNAVGCCKLCNYMKKDFTLEVFLTHVQNISKHQIRSSLP